MDNVQLVIAGIYFVLIFGVGLYAARFVKNSSDFLLAGRRLGLVLATAALAATHFGGGFVVGTGEWGYTHGLTGMAYAVGVGLALLILAMVAAKRMRRLGLVTVPDYLEHRYNSKPARILGALLSLMAIIGILGAQVWASQGALSLLGIDPVTAAVVATLLFIFYTAASGLWGVTLTDAVQLVIIFVGIPLAAILGLREVGGFAGIEAALAASEPDVVAANYFHPLGGGGALVLAAVLPAIMYTLIGQDFYQRLFATRNEKIAFRAAALAGVLLMAYAAFPAVAGMAARGLFGPTIEASQAIPMLVAEVLPAWIGAVVVAAIIGAIMSTADSLLVAGTSHLTHDLYAQFRPRRPDTTLTGEPPSAGLGKDALLAGAEHPSTREKVNDADERHMLMVSRAGTVVIGLLALVLALNVRQIIELLLLSYTMYAAGVFVPVVAGLYWKLGTATGAIWAIIAGSLTGLMAALGWIAALYEPLSVIPPIVFGSLVSFVVYTVVSVLERR